MQTGSAQQKMDNERGLDRADRLALKRLCDRSDSKGLAHLAGHCGLIALTAIGLVAAGSPGIWYAALPLQALLGVFLVSLFAPLHETVHRTAFASRWLNDAVAAVAGAVLVLPPYYFRAFHLEHHRHTQIPGKDPELPGKEIGSVGGYLLHLSGLPYWRSALVALLRHAAGRVDELFLTGAARPAAIREARLYLGFYCAVAALSFAAGSMAVLTYWVVPVLLGQPFLRFYLLAEHKLCPMVPDMFRNTRTTFSNRIVRFLAWNMPYHTEHHAFMAVPFHRLPEAHSVFKDRVEVLSPGYISFNRRFLKELSRTDVTG